MEYYHRHKERLQQYKKEYYIRKKEEKKLKTFEDLGKIEIKNTN